MADRPANPSLWDEITDGVAAGGDALAGLLSDTWDARMAEAAAAAARDRTRRDGEGLAAYLRRTNPGADAIALGFAGGGIGGVTKLVGRGAFGPQIASSSWREAVERLKAMQGPAAEGGPGMGEIVGHVSHPDIGDIGVPWGVAGTGRSDGWGLAKLLRYHGEVVDDLPNLIAGMKPVGGGTNRIRLESPNHKASVRLTWDGDAKKWLLTAYEHAPP